MKVYEIVLHVRGEENVATVIQALSKPATLISLRAMEDSSNGSSEPVKKEVITRHSVRVNGEVVKAVDVLHGFAKKRGTPFTRDALKAFFRSQGYADGTVSSTLDKALKTNRIRQLANGDFVGV